MTDLQSQAKIRPPHPSKGMNKAAYKVHRQQHVKAWQASGMSKTDYAASIGISKDAFHDWVRAFGLTSRAQPTQSTHTDKLPTVKAKAATLIPVRVQSSTSTQLSANSIAAGQMKLMLRDGLALEWSQPPQVTWLVELIKSLT
jgi:hypothetical protein